MEIDVDVVTIPVVHFTIIRVLVDIFVLIGIIPCLIMSYKLFFGQYSHIISNKISKGLATHFLVLTWILVAVFIMNIVIVYPYVAIVIMLAPMVGHLVMLCIYLKQREVNDV